MSEQQLPKCPLCGGVMRKTSEDRAQCLQCQHVVSISARRRIDARRQHVVDRRQQGPI